MGHYANELSPEDWNRQIDRSERIRALIEIIDNIPLGYFLAKDLAPLLRLKGLIGISGEPWNSDFEQLEERVTEIMAGKVKLNLEFPQL